MFTPGGEIIQSIRGSSKYFYRTDIRGSISNILNASGNVVKSYTYDAYGNTTASNNTFQNIFAYTGAVIDEESGLYYLNARYYDPATARFISEDPVRDGDSWYMYCAGDPVNCTDPTGLYNRNKAVAYATRWSHGHNFPAYEYLKDGDCANFVSQCLFAGGLAKMSAKWHSYRKGYGKIAWWSTIHSHKYDISKAWKLVNPLYNYLKGMSSTKSVVTITKATVEKSLKLNNFITTNSIRKGDALFFNKDGILGPDHSGIISSVNSHDNYAGIFYAAHTRSRKFQSIKLYFGDYPKGKIHVVRIK